MKDNTFLQQDIQKMEHSMNILAGNEGKKEERRKIQESIAYENNNI